MDKIVIWETPYFRVVKAEYCEYSALDEKKCQNYVFEKSIGKDYTGKQIYQGIIASTDRNSININTLTLDRGVLETLFQSYLAMITESED